MQTKHMHLLHKQTMKGTQRYPLAKESWACVLIIKERERESTMSGANCCLVMRGNQKVIIWHLLLHSLLHLCVLKREGCAATSARLSQINWANSTRMHGKSSFCFCSYKCSWFLRVWHILTVEGQVGRLHFAKRKV